MLLCPYGVWGQIPPLDWIRVYIPDISHIYKNET